MTSDLISLHRPNRLRVNSAHHPVEQLSPLSKHPENRRKSARYQIDLLCRCSTEAAILKGIVTNLSSGGCRLRTTTTPAKLSNYLGLDIHCFIDDRLLSVELAVVRWNVGQDFGIEFIRMTSLQQERLRYLVAFLDAGDRVSADLRQTSPRVRHHALAAAPHKEQVRCRTINDAINVSSSIGKMPQF